MPKKTLKKEFLENRVPWKHYENEMRRCKLTGFPLISQLLLEILKELQHLNEKRGK